MSLLSTSHRVRETTSAQPRRGRRRRQAATLVRPVVESLEGRLLLTGRPPGNTGTGFYVVGRTIYDANGNEFDIRGFDQNQWWGNQADNYASIAEVPKTGANAVRVVFGPGLGASTPAERAAVVAQYIAEGVVPIVEDHGATSQMDLASLNAVVDRWLDPANVQWLQQDEKYIILDIANEWGPVDYTWAQGYESAISRLRAAGINCLLMVDAGGYGSGFNDILTWWQQILDSDPQHNVVFDIHMYTGWTTEDYSQLVGTSDGHDPYDIYTELQKAVAENIPLVVGEFSWNPSSGVDSYSTQRAMQIFESLDIGWLAWSWNGNGGYGLDMLTSQSYQYNSDSDLSPFGNLIINDPTYGLKATARRASIFPPGITMAPDSGLETTQAGDRADFFVVLNSPPASDVTIPLSSSDTTEGTVSPASLTFTPADWNVPQTVTVTGVNDGLDQGNVAYTIVPGAATSQDPGYNGLVASDVAVTNIDTNGAVQIVDNGHAGWSDAGPWMPGGLASGYGGDSNFISPGIGANTATWTFAVAPGLYSIASTWIASSSAADNAPYTISNNGTDLGVLRVEPAGCTEQLPGRRRQLARPGHLRGQRRYAAGPTVGRCRRQRHRRRGDDPAIVRHDRQCRGVPDVGACGRDDRPGLHLHAGRLDRRRPDGVVRGKRDGGLRHRLHRERRRHLRRHLRDRHLRARQRHGDGHRHSRGRRQRRRRPVGRPDRRLGVRLRRQRAQFRRRDHRRRGCRRAGDGGGLPGVGARGLDHRPGLHLHAGRLDRQRADGLVRGGRDGGLRHRLHRERRRHVRRHLRDRHLRTG